MKSVFEKIRRRLFKLLECIFNILFPIKNNKIVISNFFGKGYGCSLKPVVEQLLKYNDIFDIVWLVNEQDLSIPKSVRQVKYNSCKSIYELSTARIWLDNQFKTAGQYSKRKSQKFILIWHGGFPLKKLGIDNPSNSIKRIRDNTNLVDVIVSGCKFRNDIFTKAYLFNKEFLNSGLPRNDIFFYNNQNIKDKVYNFYGLTKTSAKLIMYAPTFREDKTTECYDINLSEIYNHFSQKEDVYVFYKLHPHISNLSLSYDNPHIINASKYNDMQELLYATDILISDYSNIMFEYALQMKPCIIYTSDAEKYITKRGFYFDITKLPFPYTQSTEETINAIENFDIESYRRKLDIYYDEVGSYEKGDATKKVVNYIYKLIR